MEDAFCSQNINPSFFNYVVVSIDTGIFYLWCVPVYGFWENVSHWENAEDQ